MTIGSRIKQRREALGISVEELAAKIGRKPSTIYDLERGDSKSTTVLHKIAAYLRTNLRWLETGKGDPDANQESVLLGVAEDKPVYGWPFAFDSGRFKALTAKQQAKIEAIVLSLIEGYEEGRPRPRRPQNGAGKRAKLAANG